MCGAARARRAAPRRQSARTRSHIALYTPTCARAPSGAAPRNTHHRSDTPHATRAHTPVSHHDRGSATSGWRRRRWRRPSRGRRHRRLCVVVVVVVVAAAVAAKLRAGDGRGEVEGRQPRAELLLQLLGHGACSEQRERERTAAEHAARVRAHGTRSDTHVPACTRAAARSGSDARACSLDRGRERTRARAPGQRRRAAARRGRRRQVGARAHLCHVACRSWRRSRRAGRSPSCCASSSARPPSRHRSTCTSCARGASSGGSSAAWRSSSCALSDACERDQRVRRW